MCLLIISICVLARIMLALINWAMFHFRYLQFWVGIYIPIISLLIHLHVHVIFLCKVFSSLPCTQYRLVQGFGLHVHVGRHSARTYDLCLNFYLVLISSCIVKYFAPFFVFPLRSTKRPKRDYSPLPWSDFFTQSRDIQIGVNVSKIYWLVSQISCSHVYIMSGFTSHTIWHGQ